MSEYNNVLFHISTHTSCNEMFVLIDEMIKNNISNIFTIYDNNNIYQHAQENFYREGIDYIDGSNIQNISLTDCMLNTVNRCFGRAVSVFDKDYMLQSSLSYKVKIRLKHAESLIEKINPKCIVFRGDRHIGELWELALQYIAGKRNIKRVIIPIANTSIEGLSYVRRADDSRIVPEGSPLLKEFKKQIFYDSISGQYLIYKKPYVLRALRQRGVIFQNPWVMGSGASDLVLVESRAALNSLVSSGCPKHKVKLTGHGSHDKLYKLRLMKKDLKKVLFEKYNLSFSKKLIILALPQLAEHNILDWDSHWEEISFLCQSATNFKANVVLSLHPRVDRNQYAFIEKKYGLSILDERLIDVIVVADIYMSTFSSTVEWSILSSVPTVIYDFYNFNYKIYDHLNSKIVIKDKDIYIDTINEIINDTAKYNTIKRKVYEDSENIGCLDGKCIERIISYIDN